jgi:thymidine phosphorylase
MKQGANLQSHQLRAKRLHLESQTEPLVIMHKNCPVCRSEGFRARSRVELKLDDRAVVATLYQLDDGLVAEDEAGLSEAAWRKLRTDDGDVIEAAHPRALASLSAVRAKLYGRRLSAAQLTAVVADITAERYSDVELSAFIAAYAAQPFGLQETASLTSAMVASGKRLNWHAPVVADKHCVGGLPGNRTSPIVVAIAAAAGLLIPKSSSRAITSPAGTADVMATMTNVELSIEAMQSVVEQHGGCLAWGGSLDLSPADDIIIKVERALDVDCEAQLIASVLSKKIAAGSTHVLLDIPVGPTAKVRSSAEGRTLAKNLVAVGKKLGLAVRPSISDGSQPIGRGVGPALEAHDVLAVLRNKSDAPPDLRAKSLALSAELVNFTQGFSLSEAIKRATGLLESGAALKKFLEICEAQGGFREPSLAPLQADVLAAESGRVSAIDNRLLARAAKLAGAPAAPTAGLKLHVDLGQTVLAGDPLFTLHAEAPGELDYALAFVSANPKLIGISAQ